MKISVVIPCHNKAGKLPLVLDALAKQTLPRNQIEVIVVDDGSTDWPSAPPAPAELSPEKVESPPPAGCAEEAGREAISAVSRQQTMPNVRTMAQVHQGAGMARNLGASTAGGDILLFLDADIVLQPEALEAHLDAHEKYDKVLLVSRVLPVEPDPVGVENAIFQKGFDPGEQERTLPGVCAISQALSVKVHHFHHIGGFAADLPRGQDIELGFRAVGLGYEIRSCPGAVGRHHHAMDLDERCRIERRNHEQLVLLFRRIPQLVAGMGYLRRKLPIEWGVDRWPTVAAKLLRQLVASPPALLVLKLTWKVLRRVPLPKPKPQHSGRSWAATRCVGCAPGLGSTGRCACRRPTVAGSAAGYQPTPHLSVALVNWNNRDYLRQCLESIEAMQLRLGYEIVVSDNGSTDGSLEMLAREFPDVRIIRSERNVGVARGNNQCIRNSEGRYIYILNNDTIVNRTSVEAMVAYLDDHPEGGAVGGNLLNPDGSLQASFCHFPTLWEELLLVTHVGRRLNPLFPSHEGRWPEKRTVDWISSASILVRRTAIEQIGLIDEDYFIYSDETDWQYRLWKAGWKVWYLPDVTTIHFGGGSFPPGSRRYTLVYRGRMLFAQKHYARLYCLVQRGLFALAALGRLIVWCVMGVLPRWRQVARRQVGMNWEILRLCVVLA